MSSYGFNYVDGYDYQRIIVENSVSYSTSATTGTYNGQKYRIVKVYYNRPLVEKKKTGFKHWNEVNKAFNIAIGFTKPYIWVPATILGLDFSKLEDAGPESYVKTSIYTHMEEKYYQFVTKGHPKNDWANYAMCQKATIEDTTIAYRLVNKKKNLYTSVIGKNTQTRKTAHFNNKSWMLKKAYEYWTYSYPTYREYVK